MAKRERSNKIGQFLDALAAYVPPASGPDVFNPWVQCCELDIADDAPSARCLRLAAHLNGPLETLLIGEAPGYRGCRYSGIPFTSERLLLGDWPIPRVPRPPGRLTSREIPFSEPSATVVWGSLRELGIEGAVGCWNAFPFHPYKPGVPLSNRTPTEEELALGSVFLARLLATLPPGIRLIAVGKKAAETLIGMGYQLGADHAVRHPSMGGATAFRTGLQTLFPGKTLEPWVL